MIEDSQENTMARASFAGRTLGRYRVLEPLGHGGMAWVYRAYHPQLDRYVAIKVLRSDLVDDEEFLARFQREARAVAGLRHPHIVQVFDFDVDDDAYYMVMELLEGDTLTSRLNDYRVRGEQMPLGEAVRILLDVLDGLAYAHSEGMIHRDLKPSNILLTKRGQAVVGDFGIAHMVGGTRYTNTGALMGTPEYMAPEQGLQGQCDARSDIYSVGVILYEVLTQHVPFEAETPLAVLMKHVNDPLPLPRESNPDIPPALERVVLKAMAKHPEDRYPSAETMAEALQQAVADAAIPLPERISLPLSFHTAQTPSESVAVISGPTQRDGLNAEIAEADTEHNLVNPFSDAQSVDIDEVPRAPVDGSDAATEEAVSRRKKRNIWQNLFLTLGIVVSGNLLAITISSMLRNWAIFERGWPMELLLVGGALFILMATTRTIWLFVPAGLITANGLLFAYTALTNNWHHWAFLWVIEPWVVTATVIISKQLVSQPENAHRISHLLGWAGGITTLIGTLAVQGAALLSDLVGRLVGWIG